MRAAKINKVNKVHQQSFTLLMRPINKVNKEKTIVEYFVEAESVDKAKKNTQNQQSQQSIYWKMKLEN